MVALVVLFVIAPARGREHDSSTAITSVRTASATSAEPTGQALAIWLTRNTGYGCPRRHDDARTTIRAVIVSARNSANEIMPWYG